MSPVAASTTAGPNLDLNSAVDKRPQWVAACVLALVSLVVLWVRFRLAPTPLERDEGEYAYMGQLLLQGVPPYREAYNMKFPGTYLSYAGLMALFGQTAAGIRYGLMLVNALTALGIFVISRRLFSATTGLWAAAFYLILSVSPGVLGLFGHATHFVVLWAVWGFVLLEIAKDKRSAGWAFLSGMVFGGAVLMKQHGALFGFFGVLYLLGSMREGRWKCAVANLGGQIAVLVVTGLWLWRVGVFDKFWFWTIDYARQYAGANQSGPLATLWMALTRNAWEVGFGVLGLAGIVALWARRSPHRVLITGWLVAAFLSAAPGWYFRVHYFIPLLAPLAIAAAVVIAPGNTPKVRWPQMIGWALGIFSIAFALYGRHVIFFQYTPEWVSRRVYVGNPFSEMQTLGEYLNRVTPKDATIAVLGSEPQVYFYANRRAATGYLYTYSLMEAQPFASKMQREMVAEIEKKRPKYILFVNAKFSWLAFRGSDRYIFDWWGKYREHYEPAVLVVREGELTSYVWSEPGRYQGPGDPQAILMRRKDGE